MKILVGVDDSPYSKAAIDFLKSSPWVQGAHLILLSAVRVPVLVTGDMMMPPPEYDALILKTEMELHRKLLSEYEPLFPGAARVETRLVNGDPRIELEETARKEQVDLLVIGSHGRTGLARLLIGSVASHVVSHAPCSVLVVKNPGPSA
jgi:nucleotide-binding universal stress UspA family protein